MYTSFFFLGPWAAQMAQTEEFMFWNVAYRPTVYKTGVVSRDLLELLSLLLNFFAGGF